MEDKLNYKVTRFKEIVTELADLYEKKNHNYGDSFGQLYDTLGPISGLVPLHNKLDRVTNLIKGDSNHFESIEDTLRDLANYAIMNLIEMELRRPKEEMELRPIKFIKPPKDDLEKHAEWNLEPPYNYRRKIDESDDLSILLEDEGEYSCEH